MLAPLLRATSTKRHPHVRRFSAWHDSLPIADLLETTFHEEIQISRQQGDDNAEGQQMIRALRTYGPIDAMMSQTAPAFVWEEEGQLLGNVSIQRNPTRTNTWVIGNVATHPNHRNRGISTALMQAALEFAQQQRGVRHLALQVVDGNSPAMHLYEKFGFETVGKVTRYHRASVWTQTPATPSEVIDPIQLTNIPVVRSARWSDRDLVWNATHANVPDALTYSEPFDESPYRLGLRWSFSNNLGGNREHWHVGGRGAVRTRANFEVHDHYIELMLMDDATVAEGVALLAAGLHRFTDYISKSLLTAQSHPHPAAHTALKLMGFVPRQTFIHMKMDL